jgi:phage terminase large subunit GpA-like protein
MEAPTLPEADTRFLLDLICAGIRPDPRRTVAEWADAHRIVTEGAFEGPWRTSRTPYLREPMEKATLTHPCRRVTFRGAAQIAKTQLGLNLLGQVLAETPAKCLVVLPSINSARMYNRDKLDPMLTNTPTLAEAVADITSRDSAGSTTTVKKGARGAQVEIVTASSSKDLQSRTVRVLVLEEISEYPADVDNRGDPVDLAMARTIAWRGVGEKVLDISTPAIKPTPETPQACRITTLYEQGSGAEFHVPCPHCGTAQTLKIGNLTWPRDADGKPDHAAAAYACDDCGTLIEEAHKRDMLEAGAWIHARPHLADRHASYHLSALYSPFVPWREVAREADAAAGNPTRAKAFAQQWLGEPWDEAFDLPKADILLLRRDKWQPGRIPPSVLFLMGATDVQGDRLPWAVWGFDRNFGQWLIDTGTLEGDPTLPDVWRQHDELLRRRWTDAWGKPMAPNEWGIDTGFVTSTVYSYVYKRGMTEMPQIKALDGRKGWKLPPIGTRSEVKIDPHGGKSGQKIALWPVATWDMKSELASALRLTEMGPGPDGWPPGALRFNEIVDRAWLDELLSEHCVVDPKTGQRAWKKVNARNEAWDLAVYTRALARAQTLKFTDATWLGLAAGRQGPPDETQPDLAQLWAPDLKAQAEAAIARPPPTPIPPPAAIGRGRTVSGAGRALR